MKNPSKTLGFGLILLSLAACASNRDTLPPAPNVILKPGETIEGQPAPSPVATARPVYKVGKPYKIAGVWYYPEENTAYDAVGTASWYGPKFHGRLTANGEVFDMDRLSAAHPTLPLPSYVEVTNLKNGKKVVLRVNDRGPFASGREIDLSRAAAQKLGYKDEGLAKVRVRFVAKASLDDAIVAVGHPEPDNRRLAGTPLAPELDTVQVRVATGSEEASEKVAKTVTGTAAPITMTQADYQPDTSLTKGIYLVQVGAFSSKENANRASSFFTDEQPVRTSRLKNANGQALYHVRLGPFQTENDAKAAKFDAISAGFEDARIFQP